MSIMTDWLDRTFYAGISSNWPDCLLRDFILRIASPEHCVLDLGAGAGIIPELNMKDMVRRVAGVDPDLRVLQNPYLHEARTGSGSNIPYGDNQFDIVISNNVLEHLVNPDDVFKEIARVLKPGGSFIAKTPNRNHYVPVIASLTPTSFHRFYGRLLGRDEDDTFPTYYRANSKSQIERLCVVAGLSVVKIETIERRPEYLRINAVAYVAGIVFERLVNWIPTLSNWRILLLIHLRKPL